MSSCQSSDIYGSTVQITTSQTNAVQEADSASDEVPEQALQSVLDAFDAALEGLQLALSLEQPVATRDIPDDAAERTERRFVSVGASALIFSCFVLPGRRRHAPAAAAAAAVQQGSRDQRPPAGGAWPGAGGDGLPQQGIHGRLQEGDGELPHLRQHRHRPRRAARIVPGGLGGGGALAALPPDRPARLPQRRGVSFHAGPRRRRRELRTRRRSAVPAAESRPQVPYMLLGGGEAVPRRGAEVQQRHRPLELGLHEPPVPGHAERVPVAGLADDLLDVLVQVAELLEQRGHVLRRRLRRHAGPEPLQLLLGLEDEGVRPRGQTDGSQVGCHVRELGTEQRRMDRVVSCSCSRV